MNNFTVIQVSTNNAQNLAYAVNALNSIPLDYEADKTYQNALDFVFEGLTEHQRGILLEVLIQNNVIYQEF